MNATQPTMQSGSQPCCWAGLIWEGKWVTWPICVRHLPTGWAKLFLKKKRQKSILPPPTITKVWFSSYNYKTGYFTSLNFSNRPFYLPRAVLKAVCYSNRSFVFFFFKKNSVESLKNHSKSQKNHKIENPILLDSTWVDIRSEYIIWYTLVQFFYCNFRYILFYN